MRAIYWRRSVWWPTLTPLAIVGGAAIIRACSGLPTPRQAQRSEGSSIRAPPYDLRVPDLQTSVTEGDVGDRWSRRLRSALLPACWA